LHSRGYNETACGANDLTGGARLLTILLRKRGPRDSAWEVAQSQTDSLLALAVTTTRRVTDPPARLCVSHWFCPALFTANDITAAVDHQGCNRLLGLPL